MHPHIITVIPICHTLHMHHALVLVGFGESFRDGLFHLHAQSSPARVDYRLRPARHCATSRCQWQHIRAMAYRRIQTRQAKFYVLCAPSGVQVSPCSHPFATSKTCKI